MVAKFSADTQSVSPQAIFEEAVALQKEGDHKSALKRYKKLLKNEPDHPQILNMCALATAELGDLSGWIEFGRPQDHPMSKAEPQLRSYQPHEGMVVLFPSYFYHHTEPFESQEQRISIAFDIVPLA